MTWILFGIIILLPVLFAALSYKNSRQIDKKTMDKILENVSEVNNEYHLRLKAATNRKEKEEAYNWYMGEIDEILEREGL